MFLGLCRDEIYCQICKQLVNNKNKRSSMQGWVLLSICLGIFAPTDIFIKVSLQQAFSQSAAENLRLHNKKLNKLNMEILDTCIFNVLGLFKFVEFT